MSLCEIWEAVGETGEVTLDQNATIRLASTWAIKQAREVVEELYHAAGATAIFDAQPFERRFRDMHTIAQQMQGAQRHFETVGEILLGLEPDAKMYVAQYLEMVSESYTKAVRVFKRVPKEAGGSGEEELVFEMNSGANSNVVQRLMVGWPVIGGSVSLCKY